MHARYPAYVEPEPAVIADLWGSAQYHDYRGNDYNVSRWTALNFKVYWDASFPFGWWGNFLPSEPNYSLCVPVGHANTVVPWSKYPVPTHPNSKYECDALSYEEVAGWYSTAKANGFQALVYANLVRVLDSCECCHAKRTFSDTCNPPLAAHVVRVRLRRQGAQRAIEM